LIFTTAANACGGKLGAFALDDASNDQQCSWIDIAQPTGYVDHRYAFDGCSDRGTASNGLAQVEYDEDDLSFLFMTGTGSYIHDMNQISQTSTIWGILPQKYNYTVGLNMVYDYGVFLLTTSELYFFSDHVAAENRTGFLLSSNFFTFY